MRGKGIGSVVQSDCLCPVAESGGSSNRFPQANRLPQPGITYSMLDVSCFLPLNRSMQAPSICWAHRVELHLCNEFEPVITPVITDYTCNSVITDYSYRNYRPHLL